ncbi:LacI family DNA-binding transcriptional regulator [Arthrobacter sp. OVS8]|nr:LacI family DNA-binding transcriptional regulator [Arthrobacter sp. OVS8]
MLQAKAPRATIQDVAALSGLSICTVSRALRNLPNVSVNAQAKVSDAAAKLGYKASPAASRLAAAAPVPSPSSPPPPPHGSSRRPSKRQRKCSPAAATTPS